MICKLDKKEGKCSVAYNEDGDFVLSSLGDGDIDMPALNQSEGTFVNRNRRVAPLNAALSYGGYELNDIANELDIYTKHIIDYTKELPTKAGFLGIDFDDINESITDNATGTRGYELNNSDVKIASSDIDEPSFDDLSGIIAYRCNPITQFSYFTNKTSQLKSEAKAVVSTAFLEENSFVLGDSVEISNSDGKIVLELEVNEDFDSKNIILIPTFNQSLNGKILFEDTRFCEVSIKKV
jgi:NADH-quinone oxidoreductase subunit G